jgi:hypothetical protein
MQMAENEFTHLVRPPASSTCLPVRFSVTQSVGAVPYSFHLFSCCEAREDLVYLLAVSWWRFGLGDEVKWGYYDDDEQLHAARCLSEVEPGYELDSHISSISCCISEWI